jgi:hypothetical protein
VNAGFFTLDIFRPCVFFLYDIKCMLIFGVKLPIRYPFHEIWVSLRLNLRCTCLEALFFIFSIEGYGEFFSDITPIYFLEIQYSWNIVESGVKHHNPNLSQIYSDIIFLVNTDIFLSSADKHSNTKTSADEKLELFIYIILDCLTFQRGPSWSWSYCSGIDKYLFNQCL